MKKNPFIFIDQKSNEKTGTLIWYKSYSEPKMQNKRLICIEYVLHGFVTENKNHYKI